jgi:hypothetical protein
MSDLSPDLSDQLRAVADEGARQARPQAVADVIRRGNRYRQRTIAQRSLGGLSVLGLGAAMIMTGAAGHHPAPAAASGKSSSLATVTSQATTSAAKISIDLKYRHLAKSKDEFVSLSFSAHSDLAIKNPAFVVQIINPVKPHQKPGGTGGINLIIKVPEGNQHDFSGTAAHFTVLVQQDKRLAAGGTIAVYLINLKANNSITVEMPPTGDLVDGVVLS